MTGDQVPFEISPPAAAVPPPHHHHHHPEPSIAIDTNDMEMLVQKKQEDDGVSPPHDTTQPDHVDMPLLNNPPSGIDIYSVDAFPSLPTTSAFPSLASSFSSSSSAYRQSVSGRDSNRSTSPTVPKSWTKAAAPSSAAQHITERVEVNPRNLLDSVASNPQAIRNMIRHVKTSHPCSIEFSTGRDGSLTFLITASSSNAAKAKLTLMKALCKPARDIVSIPYSIRSFVVGKGGHVIKTISDSTHTRIEMPRRFDEEPEDDPFVDIVITGDAKGVELAKQQIEELAKRKIANHRESVIVEHSYHLLLPGPDGCNFKLLENQFKVKVAVPPEHTKSDQVFLIGIRDNVELAKGKFLEIVENLKSVVRTISLPIKKSLHRHLVGHRGAFLNEVLMKTGCYIELPDASAPDNDVKLYGPELQLSHAITQILEKANALNVAEVNVPTFLPHTVSAQDFLRYFFLKNHRKLKDIEAQFDVSIEYMPGAKTIVEIHSKSQRISDQAKAHVESFLKDLCGQYCFVQLQVPEHLIKYVVGKEGKTILRHIQNPVYDGRFLDIHFDDHINVHNFVVKRLEPMSVTSNPKDIAESDAECQAFANRVYEDVLREASAVADTITYMMEFPNKHYRWLIGQNRTFVKSSLGDVTTVNLNFPKSASSTSSTFSVTLKGPSSDVATVKAKIEEAVEQLNQWDTVAGASDRFVVPKDACSRFIGAGYPNNLAWISRAIHERLVKKELSSVIEKKCTPELFDAFFHLRMISESLSDTQDEVTLWAPKFILATAKDIVLQRLQDAADKVAEVVPLFDRLGLPSSLLQEHSLFTDDSRTGYMFRTVLSMGEKHDIFVFFQEEEGESSSPVMRKLDISSWTGNLVFKGNRHRIKSAVDEVLAFFTEQLIARFSMTFLMPLKSLGYVVGRNGSRIHKLKDEFNVRIDFGDIKEDDMRECKLTGLEAKCEEVKKILIQTSEEVLKSEIVQIPVPEYLHRSMIGTGGENIKSLIASFGGPEVAHLQFSRMFGSASKTPETKDFVFIRASSDILSDFQKAVEALMIRALCPIKPPASLDDLLDETIQVTPEQMAYLTNSVSGRSAMASAGITAWPLPKSSAVRLVTNAKNTSAFTTFKANLSKPLETMVKLPLPGALLAKMRDPSLKELILHTLDTTVIKFAKSKLSLVVLVRQDGNLWHMLVDGDVNSIAAHSAKIADLLNDIALNEHMLSLPFSSDMKGLIIGRNAATLNRIRSESGAQVDIPVSKNVAYLRARTADQLAKAKGMIEAIIHKPSRQLSRSSVSNAEDVATSPVAGLADGHAGTPESTVVAESVTTERHIPGYSKKKVVTVPVIQAVPVQNYSGSAYLSRNVNSGAEHTWQEIQINRPSLLDASSPVQKLSLGGVSTAPSAFAALVKDADSLWDSQLRASKKKSGKSKNKN